MIKDKVFWSILLFAIVYIIGNIGTGSLTTWDEAVYANVSGGIMKGGNWIVPELNGRPWVEKPPLYMWLTAVFYRLLGVSEFSTRMTSAIFGVMTVLLLYLFVSRVFNGRAAVFSALILLGLPHYLHFAKMGMLDVMLTFFILLMVYFFILGQDRPARLFWSGAVFSLAYLTKGPAALLGPAVIFSYCFLSGKLKYIYRRQFITGIGIAVLIICLWHLLQYFTAGGAEALNNYFAYHIFQRAISGIEEHRGGINFYQKALFNKNMPWGILMYSSFLYMLYLALKKREGRAILVCCWIVVTYLLYSAVKTKLHWYIIPVYPALAIASGVFLERLFRGRFFKIALIVIFIAIVLQAKFSRAFDLDFNPEVKKACGYARDLSLKGNDVYMFGVADAEIFYCDFAKILDQGVYRAIIEEKQPTEAFCVTLPEYIKDLSLEYNAEYDPVYETKRVSIYKIKFKSLQPSS